MRGNDKTAMVLAAKALGRLAVPGGSLTAELVESEVKSALEYLQTEQQDNRRFAAVLTLRELAANSPTHIYGWIPEIFEVIWIALRDKLVLIRESAAEAVSECFKIIAARDGGQRHHWLIKMWDEILRGLSMNSIEAGHGSLLTLKEILLQGGMFMHSDARFQQACDIVYKWKDHRDALIRREVVAIIPILAAYSPQDFKEGYLHMFMNHLQGLLKKERDRNPAFVAIGKIARAMSSAIQAYLDGIISYIREGLLLKAYRLLLICLASLR